MGIALGNTAKDPEVGGTNSGRGQYHCVCRWVWIYSSTAQYPKVLGNSIYLRYVGWLVCPQKRALAFKLSERRLLPPRQRLTALTRAVSATIDCFSQRQLNLRDRPTLRATTSQGKTFLGFENETEGPSGEIDFTFSPTVPLTSDEFITATITPAVDQVGTTVSTVPSLTGILPTITATSSDVSVSMSASPNPVAPGGTLLYTITVTNTGSDAASNVSLSDILPAGTTFNSFSAANGWTATTPATGGTGTVSATIASLAANASASFSLVVQVDPSAANGATIANSASVNSTSTDSDSSNNSASQPVTVHITTRLPSPTTTGLGF